MNKKGERCLPKRYVSEYQETHRGKRWTRKLLRSLDRNSIEYISAHGERQIQRGRNPSSIFSEPLQSTKNPRVALAQANNVSTNRTSGYNRGSASRKFERFLIGCGYDPWANQRHPS